MQCDDAREARKGCVRRSSSPVLKKVFDYVTDVRILEHKFFSKVRRDVNFFVVLRGFPTKNSCPCGEKRNLLVVRRSPLYRLI